jgi:hypothetical protein
MIVDYVKDPTHYCQEHDEWYYFHCRKCFAPHGDESIPLRGEAAEQPRRKRPKRGK